MADPLLTSDLAPIASELPTDFALRLEAEGMDEFACRIAVRRAFGLSLSEAIEVCGALTGAAMLRTARNLLEDRPEKASSSQKVRLVASRLGLSDPRAAELVRQIEVGDQQ